jgi:hypothetical protein
VQVQNKKKVRMVVKQSLSILDLLFFALIKKHNDLHRKNHGPLVLKQSAITRASRRVSCA